MYAALRTLATRFDLKLEHWLATRPILTLLVAGALSALAMPPFGLFPILFVTLPVLYRSMVVGITASFKRGWAFSFGFLVCGLYWIASSMLVDLAAFWWAIPLAVLGLPFYLSLYTGLAMAGFAALQRRYTWPTAARVLLFAVLLSLADIGRGTLFTGFPWNMMGQAWQHAGALLQSVSLFGIYGLTLLTYFIALLPVLLTTRARAARRLATAIVAATLLLTVWGTYRLSTATDAKVDDVQLRLVQPNIAQSMKVDPEAYATNFAHTLGLTSIPAIVPPSHVIWPEAAVPFLLNQNEEARLEIGARTPRRGLTLTGAPWRTFSADGEKIFSNALVTIDEIGRVNHQYDKFHLVPFGEYFPWRRYLISHFGININAIAAGAFDFTGGPGPRAISLPGLPPVSPLICYEIIFSGEVTPQDQRAGWLLNITNDAWFGSTTGPYQHFEIARLRAIEEGLPLVRVANTGISGIIDAYGRVLAKTTLNTSTALDMGLPVSLPPTPFSRFKHLPYLAFILLCGAMAFGLRRVV